MVKYTSPATTAISDTPPSESDGKVWVDTSENPPQMKLYDSATGAFISASAKETIVSQTRPTPERGKIWFEPVQDGIGVYKGLPTEWQFLEFLFDIPDSVVSRPGDNSSSSDSQLLGMRLETDVEWPEIGARISSNSSGLTRAYIYRVSDGQLMGETDISSVSAGETFTMTLDSPLVDGETYNFVADAEGASYTTGFNNSPSSYPYKSSDGDLRFPNGAVGTTGSTSNAFFIDEAGDVGF